MATQDVRIYAIDHKSNLYYRLVMDDKDEIAYVPVAPSEVRKRDVTYWLSDRLRPADVVGLLKTATLASPRG